MSKKVLSLVLVLVLAFGVSLGASAATTNGVFEGYKVSVLDTTTPATTVWIVGSSTDCTFFSVDNKALGSISEAAYMAIMEKYNTNTSGSGPHLPPDGYGGDWQVWFAEQFNLYRGLSAGAGQATQAEYTANQIEEYRQEVIRLVNVEREKVGRPLLAVDEDAMAYAQIRAQELEVDYSHVRPNGAQKEVNGIRPTENIAMGGYTPETVIAAWMASEAHKGNILNVDAYAIVVGVYYNSGGNAYWALVFLW